MTDTEWHHWRGQGIGGSDIGALLGLSSWTSPWGLWADKRGLIPPSPETERQRIGKRMESVLAAEFHDSTGLVVAGEQTWCTFSEWPVARCTVDGFVVAPDGPIEAQHLDTAALQATWQCKTDGRRGWDEIPPAILAQCRWEMGVTGLRAGWLTVMFSGWRIEHVEIPWDDEDWTYMLAAAREFWALVESGTEPEIDGSDATARALRAVYPAEVKGERADLADLREDIARLEEIKALQGAIAKLGDGAEVIENRIKARMRDAEIGTLDGEPVYVMRSVTRKASTIPATTYRTLRKATKRDQEAA